MFYHRELGVKKNKKSKKIILTVIVLCLILFALLFKFSNDKKINEYKKALVFYECEFVKINSSEEEEFEKDLYIRIPYKPVDDLGTSNQYYYEQIIKTIAVISNKTNFRIIDEEQPLIVRVRFENGEVKYTINGSNNYYETQKALLKSDKTINNTNLTITSSELNKLIEADWERAEIKKVLGNIEKTEEDYDIYNNASIKTKTINLNVFNIIFTKNYENEVFSGIKTGLDNKEIIKILGKPTFENQEANKLIGYKTDNYYAFFTEGNISVYRIEHFNENKNEEFAKLVTELLESKDYTKFLNVVTEIYPEFSNYKKESNEIEIFYPQIGFSFSLNTKGKSGITIYNNYQGKITNDTKIDDLNSGKAMPSGIYYDSDDGVFAYELDRFKKEYTKSRVNK